MSFNPYQAPESTTSLLQRAPSILGRLKGAVIALVSSVVALSVLLIWASQLNLSVIDWQLYWHNVPRITQVSAVPALVFGLVRSVPWHACAIGGAAVGVLCAVAYINLVL